MCIHWIAVAPKISNSKDAVRSKKTRATHDLLYPKCSFKVDSES